MSQKILKYKIPKGSIDCKGKECETDLEFDIPMPEAPVIPTPAAVYQPTPQIIPAAVPHEHPHPPAAEGTKLTHEDLAQLIPKGINATKCVGSDCGGKVIKNEIQTLKYKTCPNGNCEANTVPKGSEICPYCTKGISEDAELDDGIDLTPDEDDSDE